MKPKKKKNLILIDYLSDKINLKRSDKYVALSDLSIYYTWKNIKTSCIYNVELESRITRWIIFCIRYSRLF